MIWQPNLKSGRIVQRKGKQYNITVFKIDIADSKPSAKLTDSNLPFKLKSTKKLVSGDWVEQIYLRKKPFAPRTLV